MFFAYSRLRALAFDRRGESCHVVLQKDVVRARLHGVDRRTLANRPGDDDERNVESSLLYERESVEGGEPWHRIVRKYDVPFLIQGRHQVLSIVDVAPVRVVVGPPKMHYEYFAL